MSISDSTLLRSIAEDIPDMALSVRAHLRAIAYKLEQPAAGQSEQSFQMDARHYSPDEAHALGKAVLNRYLQAQNEPVAKWYIGTQNDIAYVIDGPPCQGNDHPIHDHGPNVLATIPAGKEATDFAEVLVDLHNKSVRPIPAAPAVPEGYKLVPIDPTIEMRRAGNIALHECSASETPSLMDRAFYVYEAMLAASPKQQGGPG